MESTSKAVFRIELLDNGIIFVERQGESAEQFLDENFKRLRRLAAELRSKRLPVLILNHAPSEKVSPRVLGLLKNFDFDKLAVYGGSLRTINLRDMMVRASGLEHKVLSFHTKEEALSWLQH